MKKIKLIICLLWLFCNVYANSQESNFQIVDKINANIKNVKDFIFNGTNFYLLTNEMLFILNSDGTIIDSVNHNDIIGIYWYNDILLYIDSTGTVTNKNTKEILADLQIQENFKNTYFLTKNNNYFFTYFIIGKLPTRLSYSSKIISFNNEGKLSSFGFPGFPAGLYCDNEYLWHLARKSKLNEYGWLVKYNITSKQMISEEVLPIKDPIGFVIVNGYIYTYSTFTSEIYKLKKI